MARYLKMEVDDAYRVVYDKPCEDPYHAIDGRREVLAYGVLMPLPPFAWASGPWLGKAPFFFAPVRGLRYRQ